jgi:hypothetical protein
MQQMHGCNAVHAIQGAVHWSGWRTSRWRTGALVRPLPTDRTRYQRTVVVVLGRFVDRVTLKGSVKPLRLYTYDVPARRSW